MGRVIGSESPLRRWNRERVESQLWFVYAVAAADEIERWRMTIAAVAG